MDYKKIQNFCENYLTKRKYNKYIKLNKKNTPKEEAREWVVDIFIAVIIMFFINLWLVQQFIIPTGSMSPYLPVGSRIIASKRSYGSEIFPLWKKFKSTLPQRGDCITFYNPEYESNGTIKEGLYDFIYLGTLSLVNLNKDKNGRPKEKLFVKRAIGMPGDTVYINKGYVSIKPFGFKKEIDEKNFVKDFKYSYHVYRDVLNQTIFQDFESYVFLSTLSGMNITKAPERIIYSQGLVKKYEKKYQDGYYAQQVQNDAKFYIDPYSSDNICEHERNRLGIYIPKNHILPLGDNRDNSYDGRYFGPVKAENINGRVLYLIWPLPQFKHIKAK